MPNNIGPLMSIHRFCKECATNNSSQAVDACKGQYYLSSGEKGTCALHPFRSLRCTRSKASRIKAIKSHCLDCCGFDGKNRVAALKLVRECPSAKTCVLWPYRTGHSKRVGKPLSEERKAKICENLIKARNARVLAVRSGLKRTP